MTLLDITVKPGELLEVALWVLGFIGAVCLSFGALVKILHDQMLKRLEQLDLDLKPLVTEVAVHGEQIKEIKIELIEQDRWLRNHDTRIQYIEKTMTK
jgi:hypothetical protein